MPTMIARHYTLFGNPDGGRSTTYRFVADLPPRSCGASVDLLGFVLLGG
jgi:hypothetical protein